MTVKNQQFGKVSIAAVLRHYGAHVPEGGKGWRRLKCVFHDDTTASAAVNLDGGGRYHCFACSFDGDALDLIMWREGIATVSGARRHAEEVIGAAGQEVRSQSRRSRKLSVGQGDHPDDGEQVSLWGRGSRPRAGR